MTALAENLADGRRQSALRQLDAAWPQDPDAGTWLEILLLMLGRYDDAFEVLLETLRRNRLRKRISWHSIGCQPDPVAAMGRLRQDRKASSGFSDTLWRKFDQIWPPRPTLAGLKVLIDLARPSLLNPVAGTLWAGIALQAHRVGDLKTALGAERRAALLDPHAPLLRLARERLGLPAPALDPLFEGGDREQFNRHLAAHTHERTEAELDAIIAADPAEAGARYLRVEALLRRGRRAEVNAELDIMVRTGEFGLTLRLLVLNAYALALSTTDTALAGRPPADAVRIAELLAAIDRLPELAGCVDTAALVFACVGRLAEAHGLAEKALKTNKNPEWDGRIRATQAFVAWKRGDGETCRRLMAGVSPAADMPHAEWLNRQLGVEPVS